MTKTDLVDQLTSVKQAYHALAFMACESKPCISEDVGQVLSIINQSFDLLAENIDKDCPDF
jgi:hypothetical protein